MNTFVRTLTVLTFLSIASLISPTYLLGQNQTNDPLVDQQQYLFDVHNVDQAWSYTTGSSSVRVGVYSFLSFTQNHEDLNGPRLQTSRGPLRPEFDYATEVAGILGARTNNNLGIAGIDRAGELQSYSLLRAYSTGSTSETSVGVGSETFYLDLAHFGSVIDDGRSNGVDVHLALIGLPSGLVVDYEDPFVIDVPGPMLPNPDSIGPDPGAGVDELEVNQRDSALEEIGRSFLRILRSLCFDDGCTSPPDPMVVYRQSLGNITRLGDGVLVTPAGDLDSPATSANLSVSPGRLGRYAVTVAGLQKNSANEIVRWNRSNSAPYVDVAGFATGLAGPAAMGFSAYNTEFTSTAGAAAIGAGVASLLRAENSSLSTEDVDQILKRTARDVGPTGFDDGTGAGRIDAGAALAYVRQNDVQRARRTPVKLLRKRRILYNVALSDSGYLTYGTCGRQVSGDLYKFTIRVPYANTFSSVPDVWVRWAQSDGYNTSRSASGITSFDLFSQDLRVVNADERGIDVEGYYWEAYFYENSSLCQTTAIPAKPMNFRIAYTAVGTEGVPPPLTSLSGPSSLNSGQSGTWNASVDGGSGTTTYNWSYRPLGSSTWYSAGCSGSSCTRSWFNNSSSMQTAGLKVVATKGGQSDAASADVVVQGSCSSTDFYCFKSRGLAVRDVRAEGRNGAAVLSWTSVGDVPGDFVVEHRADSTGAWASLGSVSSASGETTGPRSTSYRFEAGDLSVGTHQFRIGLAGGSGATSPVVTAQVRMEEAYRLSAYPNPVRGQATVDLAIREGQDVSVRVYDVLGRRVATLHDGPVPGQEATRMTLNAAQHRLSSGTYFIRVTGDQFTGTERITVVR